jgi:stage II sporulation protein D
MHAEEPLPDNGDAGEIRVALFDTPPDSAVLLTTSRVILLDRESHAQLASFPPNTELRVTRSPHAWTIAGRSLPATSLEIRPASSPGMWIEDRHCRGTFRLIPHKLNALQVVNVLPLEHYLAAVIDGEMPADFPDEARKAQAVAARSFAVMQRKKAPQGSEHDLYASAARSQRYLAYRYRDPSGRLLAGESSGSRRAVQETRGLVCTRSGQLFRTYYSACCGGRTSRGILFFPDAETLASVDCGACDACPRHRWTERISQTEFAAALRRAVPTLPKSLVVADARTLGVDDRNALPRVTIRTANGQQINTTGAALRSAHRSLPSAWFSIRPDGSDFLLEGRGHGHGVGLCQWGAAGLARQAVDFTAILARYYQGCEIQPMW